MYTNDVLLGWCAYMNIDFFTSGIMPDKQLYSKRSGKLRKQVMVLSTMFP